jgi:hypothetical protein
MTMFGGLKLGDGDQPTEKAPTPPSPGNEKKRTKPLAKHQDPAFQRTTVYLRKENLPKLKAVAALAGMDVSEYLNQLIEDAIEHL